MTIEYYKQREKELLEQREHLSEEVQKFKLMAIALQKDKEKLLKKLEGYLTNIRKNKEIN